MSPNEVITADVALDFSKARQQTLSFARDFPTIKPKIDMSGMGAISRQANEFEKSLGAASARVLAFGAAAGSVYAVSRAFEQLVKSTIEVEKELANINVVFNLSSNQLKKFSSDLFGIANLTGQSFKTVAQVALDFSRQGLNASETLKRTADAMTLVRIGGTDLETSVKAITATLNTFNEVGLDSTKILNKIATVDTQFSVSGGVIAEALTRVSATAKDAGVSFDSLIGITTALQQITSRGGAVIGNSLKSIFQRIQRPEVIDQLNQMGIATEDLNGNMLSADVILTKVAKSYDSLSRAQQQQITQLAAGLFQANQFKAIIGDLAKDNGIAARATIIASTATDQATRRQEELNKTLAAQLQVSLNNLEQFAAKAGQISIAPALKNIFNIGGAITEDNDVIGRNIGEGMLRGLGNYLSGPGLALIGVLLGKFFLQFSSYIGESLTTVLKTGSARYEQEQKISALLSGETGLMQQLVALGGNQEAKQKLILDFFSQQNQMLSAQLALSKEIQGLTVSPGPISRYFTNTRLLKNQTEGYGIGLNPKFTPNLSSLGDGISEAVNREKMMGVSPNDIRIGNSPFLKSPDNPYGLGVYNIKDEPLGISQGINRVSGKGLDPKKSGMIPNFARNYYRDIDDSFPKQKGIDYSEPMISLVSLEESLEIEKKIKQYKTMIADGIIKQGDLNKVIDELKLSQQSAKQVYSDLTKSVRYYDNKRIEEKIKNDYDARIASGIARAPSIQNITKEDFLVNPNAIGIRPTTPSDVLRRLEIQSKIRDNNQRLAIEDRQKWWESNTSLPPSKEQKISEYLARKQRDLYGGKMEAESNFLQYIAKERAISGSIAYAEKMARGQIPISSSTAFDEKLNSFGLLNLSYFSPKKTRELRDLARESGRQYEAEGVINQAGNRFFTASIIAPLVAGVAQQAFDKTIGNETATKRGFSSAFGSLGNVIGYAGLGAAVSGPAAPIGAAIGGGIGLLLELPSVLKSFSDTLPDLERNLNAVKESATKTNDAFTTYISSSEQLRDIQAGTLKATNYQRESLIEKQTEAFRNIPAEGQVKIQQALATNRFEDIYDIKSIYETKGAQTQNLINDLIKLKEKPLQTNNFKTNEEYFKEAAFGVNYENFKFDTSSPESVLKGINSFSEIKRKRRDNFYKQNISPYSNEVLGLLNSEGISLEKILSSTDPEIVKKLFTEKNLKSETGKLDSTEIQNFLSKSGFAEKDIETFSGITKELTDKKYGSIFVKDFQPEELKERARQAETYQAGIEKEQKQADDINKKWLELSETGSRAIQSFEENVLNKLSKNLQDLNVKSIQAESAIKIQEIQSGKNPYNTAFFNYQRDLVSLQRAKGEEDLGVNRSFLSQSGNAIENILTGFFQEQKTSGRSKLLNPGYQQNQVRAISEVLGGAFNINPETGSVSLGNTELSSDAINQIKVKAQEQIDRLTEQKRTIGGSLLPSALEVLKLAEQKTSTFIGPQLPLTLERALPIAGNIGENLLNKLNKLQKTSPEIINQLLKSGKGDILSKQTETVDIDSVIETNKNLIKTINKLSGNKSLSLLENSNKLDRNKAERLAQLSATYGETQATFAFERQNDIFNQANISRYGEQAFQLERGALVNPSREGAIRQRYLAQYTQSIPDILNKVRIASGRDISDPNQLAGLANEAEARLRVFGPKPNIEDEGYKKALIEAKAFREGADEVSKGLKNMSEAASRAARSLSPFADVKAGALRETNVNRAAQGQSFSGTDYAKSFLSPLEYNRETFNRDTITAVQDLGQALKDDLGKNLLSITQGAKNAGDAFKSLGLALAQSVAQKGIDIGINALFGAGVQGLQSAFPSLATTFKANGGYIPKFANGGFVNMGSGTKDDVPALLSGGEFVINKNAVNKIGKNNLDLLNQPSQYINNPKDLSSFPGVISDTINSTNLGANINLANAYLTDKSGKGLGFKTSSLLSLIGQNDANNPQNALKFGRERYAFGREQAYKQYLGQLDAFNTQQYFSLGQAYLGLIGLGVLAGRRQPTSLTPGMSVRDLSPTTGIDTPDFAAPIYNGTSFASIGGYIPRFANGGYFGGDSSSDSFKALVMGGEYVMSPQTVNKYGKSFFNNLNNTSKYASGGYVSSVMNGGNTDSLNILQDIRDGLKNTSSNVNNQSNTNQNNHVTINITMDDKGNTNNTSVVSNNNNDNNQSSTQSKNKESWDKISGMIKTNVIKTITEQSRPGGLLWSNFEKKKS